MVQYKRQSSDPSVGSSNLLASRVKQQHIHSVNQNQDVTKQHEVDDAVDFYPLQSLSPGQRTKLEMAFKILGNPTHQFNRRALHLAYDIQLPVLHETKQEGKLLIKLGESEAPTNALELFERNLVPPGAKLRFDPPFVRARPAQVHYRSEDKSGVSLICVSEFCPTYQPRSDQLPLATGVRRAEQFATEVNRISYTKQTDRLDVKMKRITIGTCDSIFLTELDKQNTFKLTQPPTSPAFTNVSSVNTWLRVEDEKFQYQSADFQAFEVNNRCNWHRISRVIKQLEDLFQTYGIPNAVVNGAKLVELSVKHSTFLNKIPKLALIACIEDAEAIARLIMQPGRQFQGRAGPARAAIIIQSHIRRIQAQKFFREYKRRRSAADVFLGAWRRRKQLDQIRKSLVETRKRQARLSHQRLKAKSTTDVIYISRGLVSEDLLEYYDKLLGLTGAIRTGNSSDQKSIKSRFRILVPEAVDDFRSSTTPPLCLATLLKYSPRAIRHIRNYIAGRPALIVPGVGGHPDDFAVGDALGIPVFASTPAVTNLFLLQSTSRRMVAQLAEADENNEEEGETSGHPVGNVLSPRTSVLLTTVLRKTSSIVRERRHKISDVARSRTSRISLSPRIDFDLNIQPRREVVQPPGDFDIYTLEKLYETLAELFTEHLPTRLWLLKIDTGEATYLRILTEVPELVKSHLELLDSKFYSDVESFLDAIVAEGGVIEACPLVDDWTNLFINMVILPNGQVQLLASGDQLHSRNVLSSWGATRGVIEACPLVDDWTNLFINMVILPNGQVQLLASGDQLHSRNVLSSWGATIPMLSIDPAWVNAVSYRLAKAMVRKGFIGHFKIDYVTFINPDSDQQVLWVTGIRPGYADSLAMLQLTLFATDAVFEVHRVTGAHYIQSKVPRALLSEGEFERACEVAIKELEAVQGLIDVNIEEAKTRAEPPSMGKILKSAISTSSKLAGDRMKSTKTVSIHVPTKVRSDGEPRTISLSQNRPLDTT
ncbi:hypothetical protein P879_01882 [Paragonimus westermani]|uniref:IQCH-like ATP-grasp domain-containing protein n=1 Tax=Paragonimus westermani TaxID=34504 RepID=A0A8T0DXG3_9TREM|nr:hypothetical protein P879_01882 [Paragonimus westermani]